jgi:hypothetical protein
MPPKIQVIPTLNQPKIEGKLWVQFWIKTSDLFVYNTSVITIVFNQNKSTFFRLFLGLTESTQNNKDLKRYKDNWTSADGFRTWTRATILLNFEYNEDNTQMDLSISTFENSSPKSKLGHSYSNASFWEISFLDLVFGDNSFEFMQMNQ